MIEARPLDDREMLRFYKVPVVSPFKGYAGRDGLRTVIVGGLTLGGDGRVWGFIDFKPGYRLKVIFKYMMRLLEEARQDGIPEIYVSRDPSYETSERLLKRAGFSLADEKIKGHEIWVWRNDGVKEDG